MAHVSKGMVRLLGFAGLKERDRLRAALAAVPGPALQLVSGPGVVALLQDEPSTPLARRGRKALLEGLQAVHRRLEIACQCAPILPMDPGAACCPGSAVNGLLEPAWPDLENCLEEFGGAHQWDVLIRWTAESVLAVQQESLAGLAAGGDRAGLAQAVKALLQAAHMQRAAAIMAALSEHALNVVPANTGQGEIGVGFTVRIPRGEECRIETALGAVPLPLVTGVSADLRGPMPPVTFHAGRLANVEAADIIRSWRRLALPETADATLLHRAWRALAAAAHPDRRNEQPEDPEAFTSITDAYHLLRPLLDTEACSLRALLRRAGYRLVLPATARAQQFVVGQAA